MVSDTLTRPLVVLVAVVLVLSVVPGIVAAESRFGGAIVVEAGETVSDLEAVGGSVLVRGTVDGDLSGAAGSVVVEDGGVVTGDLNVAAGSLRIDGRVDGDVSSGAAAVTVGETGVVGGAFEVGAADVRIDGRVDGPATVGADSLVVSPTAVLNGDLRYDADLTNEGTVVGVVTFDDSISETEFDFQGPTLPWWAGAVYGILTSLLLGAVLLLLFPGTSGRVAGTVASRPLPAVGVGLAALLAVPVSLILLAITIVGIPLSVAGAVLYGLGIWVALVYGRFAVAAWALDRVGVESRWAALVVGVVGLGLVAAVPVLGGLVDFAVLLLGLGALALTLVAARRGPRGETTIRESEPAEPGTTA
jgi:cytoskeletal protein CcmA (bactofilin family)